jgi:polar amino acid transport system permease protein
MTVDAVRETPPDRGIRYFMANQNRWSWTSLAMGTFTFLFMVIGTIAVLDAHGWTQACPEGVPATQCDSTDPLAEGILSAGLGKVLWITLALAVITWVVSIFSIRAYDSKPSKEATISGIVLAVHGAVLSGVLLWFRGSDVERFARSFLDIDLVGSRIGLVWSDITANAGTIFRAAIPWAVHLAVAGLLIWLAWRLLTADEPWSEPLRTMVLSGGVLVAIGLLLDLFGLTGDLSWLRITDRLAEIDWASPLGGGRGNARVDGFAHGIVSLGRFALLWFGYGATLGLGYRLARGDQQRDEHVRVVLQAMAILAGAGLVMGMVNGMVNTATAISFARAAKNTLILSMLGAAIGFIGGLLLSLFAMSSRAVVRAPARLYINFFRGTPLIWQISFAGAGLVPSLQLNIQPYWIAILVLGLNLAAYSAEVYRAGIQSIERGQMEAARTMGLSYLQSLQYVIVPQAIRRVIPPLLNEFVILIKDTSLVSVLGLTLSQSELLGLGRTIYASTFDATAWLGAAAGFLIITLPMIRVVTIVERRMRSGLTSVI